MNKTNVYLIRREIDACNRINCNPVNPALLHSGSTPIDVAIERRMLQALADSVSQLSLVELPDIVAEMQTALANLKERLANHRDSTAPVGNNNDRPIKRSAGEPK